MEPTSSPPPQTAAPGAVVQDGGEVTAEQPNELDLPRIPIAAVEYKIADSTAESSLSSLSSSVTSSPAAWDPKKLSSAIARRHRRAFPTQDPEESSSRPIATEKHNSGTKRLHAALAPVGNDADADLRAKRRKLVLTLQDAEEDGLTNWYTQSILYRDRIEDRDTLREILDQTLEKGTSRLSRAEVESITGEIPTPPRPPSVWTPINREEPEEEEEEDDGSGGDSDDEDGSRDAAHRPVRADDNDADVKDEDEEEEANTNAHGAAVLLPEVGDCFRARTYGGGHHPGTTWAALVQPLMYEDYLANMQTGKKVMALRRAREKEMATTSGATSGATSTNTTATSTSTTAAASSKRKKPPSTETRKNKKRQKREREEKEEAATESPASGKTDELVVVSSSSDTDDDDPIAPVPPPSALLRAI